MIQETKDFIERFKGTYSKTFQVQSRVKMLEKLELIEVDEEDTSALRLKFPPSPRSGQYPVMMDGVGKAFGADVPADVQKEIVDGLRANFEGECSEVGMYLAMARVAHREGYPEIGLYWEKAAHEEAEHAAKFAELLGEVITDSTKKNLEMRVDAENGATDGKFQLAKLAKQYNLDAIHDTVHEMARDEARHGKAFEGLLNRYFGK